MSFAAYEIVGGIVGCREMTRARCFVNFMVFIDCPVVFTVRIRFDTPHHIFRRFAGKSNKLFFQQKKNRCCGNEIRYLPLIFKQKINQEQVK